MTSARANSSFGPALSRLESPSWLMLTTVQAQGLRPRRVREAQPAPYFGDEHKRLLTCTQLLSKIFPGLGCTAEGPTRRVAT